MTNVIVTVQGAVEKISAAGSLPVRCTQTGRSHKRPSCFKQGVHLLRIKTLSGA
jgi:hypothetical protein